MRLAACDFEGQASSRQSARARCRVARSTMNGASEAHWQGRCSDGSRASRYPVGSVKRDLAQMACHREHAGGVDRAQVGRLSPGIPDGVQSLHMCGSLASNGAQRQAIESSMTQIELQFWEPPHSLGLSSANCLSAILPEGRKCRIDMELRAISAVPFNRLACTIWSD